MKLLKACIAMAAFAAIFVVPSVASAISPTLCETTADKSACHNIEVNTKIIGTNVAHNTLTKTTILKSNLGNVECETATITGTVTKNSGGVIEGEVTTAHFNGKKNTSPHGIHCNGGFGGDITVTPSHTSPTGLPWCMKATGEDKLEVRGGACGGAAVALHFSLHTATLGTCSYSRGAGSPVIGTYTTHPEWDAIGTINGGENAKFTKSAGSAFCPGTGELFMSFTLTTDLNEVEGTELSIK